ncbi:MAG TPA: carbon storage regulator CsrA [Bacteroidota bacterium]|nr:carbon storage regulator CsrA [Candidatus Kapabacteria bacterium]HRS01465.1 carbon storage regulator CsrA [Bacteroidota bacterium]HRT67721.1 carbon storage regulator CsrA [Bacteroidota bacterium]
MLSLSRKIGEKLIIGDNIVITILSADRGTIRLGIEAPKDIPIYRKEIYDKIVQLNKQAAKSEVNLLKEAISNNSIILKNKIEQKIDDK